MTIAKKGLHIVDDNFSVKKIKNGLGKSKKKYI